MKLYLLFALLATAQFSFSQESTIKELKAPSDFQTLPALKWKFGAKGPIYGSPVVNRNTVFVGSLDSTLYAIDLESGKAKWKFKTKGKIRSTVCMDGDHLFLVSGDGYLYCLQKDSGKVLWTFATGGEKTYSLYGYADYWISSPVLHDDVVYFGSGDGNVYAVRAKTGERLWNFKTDDVVHGSPVVHKEKIFIGSFDGYFYALNNQTGNLIWKFKSVGQHFFPKGEFQGTPIVGDDGLVYVGSRDFNLYALDIEKGFCHWNRKFEFGWALALTYKDKVLYAGTADEDTMYALDGATGRQLWKNNVRFDIFGGSAFTSSQMYFGTQHGKLLSLDRQTGDLRWTFKTDGYTANQANYFKSEDNFVKNDFYAMVFKDGVDNYIRVLEKLGAIYSRPDITDNFIIFSSAEGAVYCLKR